MSRMVMTCISPCTKHCGSLRALQLATLRRALPHWFIVCFRQHVCFGSCLISSHVLSLVCFLLCHDHFHLFQFSPWLVCLYKPLCFLCSSRIIRSVLPVITEPCILLSSFSGFDPVSHYLVFDSRFAHLCCSLIAWLYARFFFFFTMTDSRFQFACSFHNNPLIASKLHLHLPPFPDRILRHPHGYSRKTRGV